MQTGTVQMQVFNLLWLTGENCAQKVFNKGKTKEKEENI